MSHMGDSLNHSANLNQSANMANNEQDLSHVMVDEIFKGRLNDIILHTRQNGACIEAYF